MNFIPTDKHDIEAIERATAVGFPRLNPWIPTLLEWMQDINWPVAPKVAVLLSGSGQEIVPHLQRIFRSDDSNWKYWLLQFLCPKLQQDVLLELVSDLEKLAISPTAEDRVEEVDISAAQILALIKSNDTTNTN
jgi:hypothetical protein